MNDGSTGLMRLFYAFGALLGWGALVVQFCFAMENRATDVAEAVVRYFSYFTILCNGLAAIAFTVLLLKPMSSGARFFGRPSTLTAITVYLLVVGLVYNVILRSLWNPQGLEMIADETLHSAMPALLLVFWAIFLSGRKLPWKVIPGWMVFPLIYCIYCLFRGAMAGYYPYPFLNVAAHGYKQVFVNIGGMIVLFFVMAFLLVGVSRLLRKGEN
jgi:hypothetical protein